MTHPLPLPTLLLDLPMYEPAGVALNEQRPPWRNLPHFAQLPRRVRLQLALDYERQRPSAPSVPPG